MNKRLLIFIIVAFAVTFSQGSVALSVRKADSVAKKIEAKQLDREAQILADYLERFDSPLKNHAQDFVDAAKSFGLDWTLLPAIAGVESTFGKFTPGGYNAYGWGVYGSQAIYFKSWKDGIFTVGRGLKEGYIDRGLTDPYSINRVYAVSPYWAGKVAYFMADMEKFAQKYGQERQLVCCMSISPIKIAATSGQLMY